MSASSFQGGLVGVLDGQVALVTGGARGIGAAIVEHLAQLGARVVVADVLDAEGAALVRALGSPARFVHHDVRDTASWTSLVTNIESVEGSLSVLVNNAGVVTWNVPIVDLDDEDFRRVMEVNLHGTFLGMRAAAPALRSTGGGAIVNMSSTAGLIGYWGLSAYVASKWAIRGITKTAAIEFAPWNVRVNSVHPGQIETAMTAGMTDPEHQLIPRVAAPLEVARMVGFLASSESSYTTGAEFVVDGGATVGQTVLG